MPDDRSTREDLLRRLPHFRPLDPEALEPLLHGSRLRTYRKAQTVFDEGQEARAFYAVRRGSVKVFRIAPDGRELVLHHLSAGQSFAEAAVLNFGRFPARAEALVAQTELLEIDRAPLMRLLEERPDVAAGMIGSLSIWILELAERVETLSIQSAGARLAHHFLRLPTLPGASSPPVLELGSSKKDLATHLSITPETLSRLLRRFADRELITTHGRRITLLDVGTLEAIAEGASGEDS